MDVWVCEFTHVHVEARAGHGFFLHCFLPYCLENRVSHCTGSFAFWLGWLSAELSVWVWQACRQPHQPFTSVLGIRTSILMFVYVHISHTEPFPHPCMCFSFSVLGTQVSEASSCLVWQTGLESLQLWIYRMYSHRGQSVRKTHVIISQSQWRRNILKNAAKWMKSTVAHAFKWALCSLRLLTNICLTLEIWLRVCVRSQQTDGHVNSYPGNGLDLGHMQAVDRGLAEFSFESASQC